LKKTIINIIKYLLFAGGGAFLFYKVLEGQDIDALWAIVERTNWLYLFLSVFCGYIAFINRGVRWMQLLRPMGMNFRTIHSINAVNFGYFANLLVPRIGEVARCTVLGKKVNAPVDKLLGTVILERVIDTFMLMLLFGTVVLLKADDFFLFLEENVELPKTGVMVVWGCVAAGLGFLALFGLRRWARKSQWGPINKLIEWLRGLRSGLLSIKEVEKPGEFVFHTLFIWLMYFMMTYLCFLALEELTHLSLEDALFVMLAGGIGMVIPSPGGIGSYHYAVILSLTFIGVSNDVATAFATLVHSAQTVMILATGIVATILLYSVKNDTPNEPAENPE